MPVHVHVLTRYSHLSVDDLRAHVRPDVLVTGGPDLPHPPDYDILVSGFPKHEHLSAGARLRAVVVPFAGVSPETIDLLRDFPAVSLHTLHFNVIPTAELAVGLMLAAAKFIVPMDRELRRNDWTSRYGATPTTILAGKTATILGYGRIGRRVARVCCALDMRAVGIRRHAPPFDAESPCDERNVEVHPPNDLPALLPRSDVLIVALPLTTETDGILGAPELALLPPTAILVNVGRGRVIQEEALYTALRERRILAAGLDVWYQYPLRDEERTRTAPSQYPFAELDNVVLSPHRGGWLSAAEEARLTELARLINAAAEGDSIPGEVNKILGY